MRKSIKDIAGQKFHAWTALYWVPRPVGTRTGTYWMCSCDCGKTRLVRQAALRSGHCKSCGCQQTKCVAPGEKHGRWTVLSTEKSKGKTFAFCRCDCGTERRVDSASIKIGQSKSCGCGQGYADPSRAAVTKVLNTYQRQARDSGRVWNLGWEEAKHLLLLDCYYCGVPPSNCLRLSRIDFYYSGLDRLDNSSGYFSDNVVPACRICNIAKHAAHRDEFLSTVKRIYEHLSLQDKVIDVPERTRPRFQHNEIKSSVTRWDYRKRAVAQNSRKEAKENYVN